LKRKAAYKKYFRWFFAWQDNEECGWLEEMSRRGFRLTGRFFGLYTFTAGAPEEWLYRIDFCDVRRDFSRVEMIERNGWERAAVFGSWVYYRGLPGTADPGAIFDSRSALIERYKAILKAILFPGLPLILYFPLMSIPVRNRQGGSIALLVLDAIILLALVFVTLGTVKLRGKIRSLEESR